MEQETKIVVDAKVIREELTCSVCQDILFEPVTLFCQHTFCFECLWKEREKNQRKKSESNPLPPPKCPLCRKLFVLPFSHNNILVAILEKDYGELYSERRERSKLEELANSKESKQLYKLMVEQYQETSVKKHYLKNKNTNNHRQTDEDSVTDDDEDLPIIYPSTNSQQSRSRRPIITINDNSTAEQGIGRSPIIIEDREEDNTTNFPIIDYDHRHSLCRAELCIAVPFMYGFVSMLSALLFGDSGLWTNFPRLKDLSFCASWYANIMRMCISLHVIVSRRSRLFVNGCFLLAILKFLFIFLYWILLGPNVSLVDKGTSSQIVGLTAFYSLFFVILIELLVVITIFVFVRFLIIFVHLHLVKIPTDSFTNPNSNGGTTFVDNY